MSQEKEKERTAKKYEQEQSLESHYLVLFAFSEFCKMTFARSVIDIEIYYYFLIFYQIISSFQWHLIKFVSFLL